MKYLFHRLQQRKPFFYTFDCHKDADVLEHLACNPGTLKVTKADGQIAWGWQ
jgi:hypothetical protein